MTAAAKIAEARALIEPLTGHTPGPWILHDAESFTGRATYHYQEVWSEGLDVIAEEAYRAHGDGGRKNMRLIAASPTLRGIVPELADRLEAEIAKSDALAQENAKMRGALRHIVNAEPFFHYAGVGPSGMDHTIPGSPYDRGKLAGYVELQKQARAALGDTP